MSFINKIVEKQRAMHNDGKKRYEELDSALCQMCYAYGNDKRSLFIQCFYSIEEVVPEAINLFLTPEKDKGYKIRICKTCRGSLLRHLQTWRDDRIRYRNLAKTPDGDVEYYATGKTIPVRINGATVMLDEEQYKNWRETQ